MLNKIKSSLFTSKASLKNQHVAKTLVQESFQPITHLSSIEDPLWTHICSEVLQMIGNPAKQIRQVRLGPLSPKDTTISLYCKTAEMALIIQQYDFVILETLRQYFPSIKELNIEIN